MYRRIASWTLLVGACCVAAAVAPAVWSGAPAPAANLAPEAAGGEQQVKSGGLTIEPVCYTNHRLSCADMPLIQGGSCSCTTVAFAKKCRICRADGGGEGYYYETTCTSSGPPCQPGQNCEIQQPFERTASSCE